MRGRGGCKISAGQEITLAQHKKKPSIFEGFFLYNQTDQNTKRIYSAPLSVSGEDFRYFFAGGAGFNAAAIALNAFSR